MVFGIVVCVALMLVIGLLCAWLSEKSSSVEGIEKEVRREKILECLPGENCGVCGYESCSDLALAIAKGKAPFSSCPVGGAIAEQAIAVIMGSEGEDRPRYRAQVMCSGTNDAVRKKYIYESGADDCLAAMKLGGGEKGCKYACMGLGNCKAVCPFGAIDIVDGVAKVNCAACKGCGVCVSACPKHIIKLIPYDTYNWVGCMSTENSAKVKNNCESGCIGCGACLKVCPEGAITMRKNTLATIDYTKCSGCGMCFNVCPQGVIWKSEAYGAEGLVLEKGKKKILR